MVKNLFLSTFLSLRAHKLRVFLTMVGIIIGITAVVTVSAIGEGMKQSSLKVLDSTDANVIRLIYKVDYSDETISFQDEEPFAFDRFDLKLLRSLDSVETIAADYGYGYGATESVSSQLSYFDTGGGTEIIATSKTNIPVGFGSGFTKDQLESNSIVITYETMQSSLGIRKPQDIIGRAIDVDGIKFVVIGVKNKVEDGAMIMDDSVFYSEVPKKAFNELSKNKPINAIKLKMKESGDRQAVIDQANTLLKDQHPDLVGSFEEDRSNEQARQQIEAMLQAVVTGLLFITAISLLVGGIGVMNIMYVSVSERKREIGIRRAIGAKPITILLQFLLEAAFITLIGGVIGIFFGWGLATLISTFAEGITAIVSPGMAILSASISAAIGLIFGVIPAINAAKLDPIKAIYQ
ncbi:ABC transporter permease [Vagococcus luciliae]|uniref:Macrolide export ATP-binding/permease protein MacB n=1 Tax=Vagococcus luciliae TaxID=2920380 RepID=A0ABY5P0K0_9ENTE|nr:FtsX-like permease family protein [Vagococcus luciliae]UUV99450.1 Macrolide export ATP-binding/permease protein MacB [Vagococcus luciliae]